MPPMAKTNGDSSRLLSLIDRLPLIRVAVWGDFILDEYLYGYTRRISREAPVMIIGYKSREYSLGGAGNAARNLAALGVEVEAIGVMGADEGGREVRRLLSRSGISHRMMAEERGFATPLKTRILAGEENTKKQQILRIDREGQVPEKKSLQDALLVSLTEASASCDALLVSDYHYRTVDQAVFGKARKAFQTAGKPVTLDSRFRLLQFKGATVATPNEPEVESQLKTPLEDDRSALIEAGRSLLKKLQSAALLITRGSKGMALFEKGKPPCLLPVYGSTDIVDVTGAGDTVIAVFTAALAAGASFRDSALLANFAGGLVVMKKGTAVVRPGELKQAICDRP